MNELDGWGNPFPVHTQMYHAKAMQDALEKCEREKLEPTPLPESQPCGQAGEVVWKEKPAGWWDKTPKNTQSLDG